MLTLSKRTEHILGGAALLTALVSCNSIVATQEPPLSTLESTAGWIAFTNQNDIYLVNAEDAGLLRLTDSTQGLDGKEPSWSPDGRRIAFSWEKTIYIADRNGVSSLATLEDEFAHTVQWSPDGRRIAFLSSKDDRSSLHIVNVDGSDLKTMDIGDGGLVGLRNNWSPDSSNLVITVYLPHHYTSSAIAVVTTHRDFLEIYQWLTNRDRDCDEICYESDPAWSPDGKYIAFASFRDYGIYVMNNDGTNRIRLTSNSYIEGSAVWSPDGQKIAYVSYREGPNSEICMVNIDGSGQKCLTDQPGYDLAPAWSPDGKQIAFVSDRDGNKEIYVMNADGSDQRRLTNNTVDDFDPVWSPQVEGN